MALTRWLPLMYAMSEYYADEKERRYWKAPQHQEAIGHLDSRTAGQLRGQLGSWAAGQLRTDLVGMARTGWEEVARALMTGGGGAASSGCSEVRTLAKLCSALGLQKPLGLLPASAS